MNDCVKSIYIYWVGLSHKKKAYDIRGLPTPIPIKSIDENIIIDINYYHEHNLQDTADIREVAREYRERNKIRCLPG